MCALLIFFISFQLQNNLEADFVKISNDLRVSPQQAIKKVQELGYTPYTFGLNLNRIGSDRALEWFRLMEEIEPGVADSYRYGAAWVFYTEGLFSRAEKELRTIVITNPSDNTLNARIAFLFGQIETYRGKLKKADLYIDESYNLYDKAGKVGGKANCMHSKGVIAFFDHRLADAEKYFNQAVKLDLKRPTPELGHQINLMNALIMMYRGNFQQALSFLETATEKAPPEEQTFIQVLNINKALCYAFSGDLVKASKAAHEVDVFVDSHGGTENYLNALVSVSWYLIYKKNGWSTEGFEKTITEWIENREVNFELKNMFRFVKEKS